MIRTLTPGDAYRCIYRTLFAINAAHDRRSAPVAFANDNGGGLAA